jgi:methylmalonyl-CoA mutase C-terminal domain/subunit
MALILPEPVDGIIPLAAGGRKPAAIIEFFSSPCPDRDQKSMIHSLGDCIGNQRKELLKMENQSNKIRVLVAKCGLDGHDRGVKIVARCLRDAGMDVIYTGLHRTPEEVVNAAIQEDVDILGVSLLSGAHMTIFPRIIELLKAKNADDIMLVGGGVIPDDEVVVLKKMGVKEILLQDTAPQALVETMKRLVAERGPR